MGFGEDLHEAIAYATDAAEAGVPGRGLEHRHRGGAG